MGARCVDETAAGPGPLVICRPRRVSSTATAAVRLGSECERIITLGLGAAGRLVGALIGVRSVAPDTVAAVRRRIEGIDVVEGVMGVPSAVGNLSAVFIALPCTECDRAVRLSGICKNGSDTSEKTLATVENKLI